MAVQHTAWFSADPPTNQPVKVLVAGDKTTRGEEGMQTAEPRNESGASARAGSEGGRRRIADGRNQNQDPAHDQPSHQQVSKSSNARPAATSNAVKVASGVKTN